MSSAAVLLRGREEEQIQQMDVLHQHHAQLVEQYDQPFLHVRWIDLVLARSQYLEQRPQKRLVDQQLMPTVTD